MDNFLTDNDLQFINQDADNIITESADLVNYLNNENELLEMNNVVTSESKVIMRLGF